MFYKSAIGIQRDHNDNLDVRLDGSVAEVMVLLVTLNAYIAKQTVTSPSEYLEWSTIMQQHTLTAYLNLLAQGTEE